MRFALEKEHKDYFQKEGCIEFENLLSEKEVVELNQALESVLVKRLEATSERLEFFPFEQTFLAGRDSWRENAYVKKSVCKLRLAEIASQLSGIKPLRLGYDQLLFSGFPSVLPKTSQNSLVSSLVGNEKFSLTDISGFQGSLCGLILCLANETDRESGQEKPILRENVFSTSVGSGVYFNQETLISYWPVLQKPYQRYLLIVYTGKYSFYVPREGDPNIHFLKKLKKH